MDTTTIIVISVSVTAFVIIIVAGTVVAVKKDHMREWLYIVNDKPERWPAGPTRNEKHFHNSIGRLVNMVNLPNGKTDSNNQHAAFISTDLPEENWPWPTATPG